MKIDVSAVGTSEELHELLAKTFGFPDYYGKNWDAFDECISEDAHVPSVIEVSGIDQLHSRLPRDAEFLRRCLGDFAEESHDPKVTVNFI
jgi:ribonuclease inhibitor